MASASRFVPLQLPLAEFIEEPANKNTLSKTNRDASLLKEFLRAKEMHKELENIEAKVLDEILCTFIVEVKKKDGGEYEPTTLTSFISSFDRYLRRKGYPTTGEMFSLKPVRMEFNFSNIPRGKQKQEQAPNRKTLGL